jgi:hypothetical protein
MGAAPVSRSSVAFKVGIGEFDPTMPVTA